VTEKELEINFWKPTNIFLTMQSFINWRITTSQKLKFQWKRIGHVL
jgi:hypothetical protein